MEQKKVESPDVSKENDYMKAKNFILEFIKKYSLRPLSHALMGPVTSMMNDYVEKELAELLAERDNFKEAFFKMSNEVVGPLTYQRNKLQANNERLKEMNKELKEMNKELIDSTNDALKCQAYLKNQNEQLKELITDTYNHFRNEGTLSFKIKDRLKSYLENK